MNLFEMFNRKIELDIKSDLFQEGNEILLQEFVIERLQEKQILLIFQYIDELNDETKRGVENFIGKLVDGTTTVKAIIIRQEDNEKE